MRSRVAGLLAAALVSLSLAACATGTTDTGSRNPEGDASAFPVTIEHALGSTTIESKPERVVTVAWGNQEAVLGLGVVPVGMSIADWGDDDGDGILPWVEDRIAELGGETPVVFEETDGFDFEAVSDLAPDVILAPYSAMTPEEYETFSKIAPTVAYPDLAWGATMDQMVTITAQALGLQAQGEQLLADLDAQAAAAFAAHPELAGANVVSGWFDTTDLSQVGFYTAHDTRPAFLYAMGMGEPTIVAEESATTDQFWASVSAEQADRFDDVDLFVTYGTADTVALLQADPLLGKIPAIAAGHVLVLTDDTPDAAASNPSVLSISRLDDYFAKLAGALA
jgi:iron complex transport system substrate-binding protein